MTTHKTFKGRVRARMTKTGESYAAARHQLLAKQASPDAEAATPDPAVERLVSADAMVRGTGRPHPEWFAVLDAWGATDRSHAEAARWLLETHGVTSWWAQSITVEYERERGLRARHETRTGYSVSASRTIGVDAATVLAAIVDEERRSRWLPGSEMTPRPTRAARTARFDWTEPASRVTLTVDPRGPDKSTVAVRHERLPDGVSADRLKAEWRRWLLELKSAVEGG